MDNKRCHLLNHQGYYKPFIIKSVYPINSLERETNPVRKTMMMELISAIAAGILGTFVMTMFMNLMSHLTGYDLRVPGILGSMITMKTKPSGKASRSAATMTWGNIAHYVIGIVFAIIYQQILKIYDIPFTLINGLIFGSFAGIAAVIYWFAFIKMHPLAPVVNLKYYLASIFIAHIFLGAGIYAGFKLMFLIMNFPTDN